jgi:hypothetical protein
MESSFALGGPYPRILRETLDRPDTLSSARDCERHAGIDGLAIEENGAGAARAFVAHALRAGEPERLAERVEERSMRRDVDADPIAVHLERDVHSGRTDEWCRLGHPSMLGKADG